MKLPKKVTIEEAAAATLREIEQRFPPRSCSLAEYRRFLRELVDQMRDRIDLLDDEIGDDG